MEHNSARGANTMEFHIGKFESPYRKSKRTLFMNTRLEFKASYPFGLEVVDLT
jgi:hypothetical protein